MGQEPVHRVDVFAALSLATDFALGQPQEFALKSCRVAARLAVSAGADAAASTAVLYLSLLRYIGCNADTFLMSALLGDEYGVRRDFAKIDLGRPNQVVAVVLRALRRRNDGATAAALALAIAKGMLRAPAESRSILTGHCEVAERLAARLGLPTEIQRNLGQLYERWDGKGIPAGLKGEAVAFPVRVVSLAQDAVVLTQAFGPDGARAIIADRKGGAYDPRLAALALDRWDDVVADLDAPVDLAVLRALEPVPRSMSEVEIDAACLAIADMADMRMPHTLGHSRAVATLAEAAARQMGLPAHDIRLAARAGLVHDIGEVSIPVSTWSRPGALSEAERDLLRLHPFHTERIINRAGGAFAEIAAVAGRHHECLDGSGYFRGCKAAGLSPAARIVAAAEAWQNAIEPRPHRSALLPEAAAARLNAAIRAGRICPEAGRAILSAAGQRSTMVLRGPAAELTAREVQVLRLLATGLTARDVAKALSIVPKTAGNHIQNLYGKLGVTTRAGAVLFAVENGLYRLA